MIHKQKLSNVKVEKDEVKEKINFKENILRLSCAINKDLYDDSFIQIVCDWIKITEEEYYSILDFSIENDNDNENENEEVELY